MAKRRSKRRKNPGIAFGTVLILGGLVVASYFLVFKQPRVFAPVEPAKKRFQILGVQCIDTVTGKKVALSKCDPKDVAKLLEV